MKLKKPRTQTQNNFAVQSRLIQSTNKLIGNTNRLIGNTNRLIKFEIDKIIMKELF